MKTSLLPRSKDFWFYHASLIAVLTFIKTGLIIYGKHMVIEHSVRHIVWLFPFTLAVLYFRKLYKQQEWEKITPINMITIAIFFSALSGVFISLIQIVSLYYFSTEEFIESQLQSDKSLTWQRAIINLILYDTVNSFAFIFGWIFIYINAVSVQREKAIELKNLRLGNSLREAQLNNLSNQLNPHFLFNSLNNIRFMIHHNALSADKMLTSLSDILRYSLESSRHEKVYLHQELEIVRLYIGIVKIQLEERIDFRIYIKKEHLNYFIPPMILQMLVENAVKHGLENIRHGGSLTIESAEIDHSLRLTVSNDIPESASISSANIGIGLQNIKQRLHLLYGETAGLNIVKTNNLFTAIIIWPKEP